MRQPIKVREGQSLTDIAIQECGDVAQVTALCLLNDLSITDDLVIGSNIITPIPETSKMSIVNAFSTNRHKPASALTVVDNAENPGGIDYMGIEIDLIIS